MKCSAGRGISIEEKAEAPRPRIKSSRPSSMKSARTRRPFSTSASTSSRPGSMSSASSSVGRLIRRQRGAAGADHPAPKHGKSERSRRRYGAVNPREREYIQLMAVGSPDLKAFLVATPFFGGLSDASLDILVSMLVERRFDAGATVVAEGEPGRSMYIVRSGELVVSRLGDSGG